MDYSKKLDKQIDNKSKKYYTNFDHIMHEYMIKKFKRFFRGSNALELGAGSGNFTKKLDVLFKNVTVIEGSNKSIQYLKKKKLNNTIIIQGDLENLQLIDDTKEYHNIFLIHTYEHILRRKKLLKNIIKKLKKNGKFFLVTPNAEAVSRRLAVKMGIINKTTSVTRQEKKHGHHVTFNLNMLKKEIENENYEILDSGGIFFKALANFQIDLSLEKKIINKEYLDACYELGKEYPEFCSSIYIIAKKK